MHDCEVTCPQCGALLGFNKEQVRVHRVLRCPACGREFVHSMFRGNLDEGFLYAQEPPVTLRAAQERPERKPQPKVKPEEKGTPWHKPNHKQYYYGPEPKHIKALRFCSNGEGSPTEPCAFCQEPLPLGHKGRAAARGWSCDAWTELGHPEHPYRNELGVTLWFCCQECKQDWLRARKRGEDVPEDALLGEQLDEGQSLVDAAHDEESFAATGPRDLTVR